MVAVTPILHAGVETLSLRQLDELNGVVKGTSFKAFKRCEAQLKPGEDYFYLAADEHKALIDELKSTGVIYATTVHLLLLTREGYWRIQGNAPA